MDRLNFKAFEESKRREQERKARMLLQQKQEVQRSIDKELKNRYSDYEELLKRQRDDATLLQD